MIRTKTYTLAAVFVAAFLFIFFICNGACSSRAVAFAASEESAGEVSDGTDILSDLCADSNFDINDFPIDEKNYALRVVQIAESKQGELLLYVYQPCASVRKLYATSINMSLQKPDDKAATWDIYNLELLSTYDVFAKYRVQGFKLKTGSERYYNIASIFREWHKDIDEGLEEYQLDYITEVAFRVSQFWTVYQDGDTVHYDVQTSEVIQITEKVINKIRIGVSRFEPWFEVIALSQAYEGADCFYLAFNTDRPIDKLIKAEITYDIKHYNRGLGGITGAFAGTLYPDKSITNKKTVINHTDKQTVNISAWDKTNTYSFGDRIQSVAEFIEAEKDLPETALRELAGKQWVLRFVELSYEKEIVMGLPNYSENTIENASVLSLEFETDGQHYNLGVVDNKQSTSIWKPAAKTDIVKGGCKGINWGDFWLLWVILGILGFIILSPIIIPLLGFVFSGLLWLITVPFKALGKLFKQKKE